MFSPFKDFPKGLLLFLLISKAFLVTAFYSKFFLPHLDIADSNLFSPNPGIHYLSLFAFGAILLYFGRLAAREPRLTCRHANMVNLGYMLIFFAFSLFHLKYRNTLVIRAYSEGLVGLDDLWTEFWLYFFDPGWLAALFLFHMVIWAFLYKRPAQGLFLPLVFFSLGELLHLNPLPDVMMGSMAMIWLLVLVLPFLKTDVPPLSVFRQMLLPGLFLVPVLCGIPPVFPKTLFFVFVGIVFVLLSLITRSFQGCSFYSQLTWITPVFTCLLGFSLPPQIGKMVKIAIFSFCLPGYFFQEIILWVFFCFLMKTLFRSNMGRWWIKVVAAVCGLGGTVFVLLSFIEAQVFQVMGLRFTFQLYQFADDLRIYQDCIFPFLKPGLLIFLLCIVFGGFWDYLQFQRESAIELKVPWKILGFLLYFHLSSYVFLLPAKEISHSLLSNVVASYPWMELWKGRVPFEELVRNLKMLREFPKQKKIEGSAIRKNVLLIITESMHPSYLSLYGHKDETLPRLSGWKEHMTVFTSVFSSFIATENACFSILNGLIPVPKSIGYLKPDIACPSLFKIFRKAGYRTSCFLSYDSNFQRFRDYVAFQKPDVFYDSQNMPGREAFSDSPNREVDEKCTTTAMMDLIKKHKTNGEAFFMTYLSQSSHFPFPFYYPEFMTFKPSQEELNLGLERVAMYKNQILGVDAVLGNLMQFLKTEDLLASTTIVMVGDHGEALGERGLLGHGFHVYPEWGNVFCLIYDTRFKRFSYDHTPGSQVDLLPTILDLLNMPMPEGQHYQGNSLFSPERPGSHLIFSWKDFGMVRDQSFLRYSENGLETFSMGVASDGSHLEFGPPTRAQASTTISPEFLQSFKEAQELFLTNYPKVE